MCMCAYEYFEVCVKGKASGQNSELNTPLILQDVYCVVLCAGDMLLATKEGLPLS